MTHNDEPRQGHWPVAFRPFSLTSYAAPLGFLPGPCARVLIDGGLMVADGAALSMPCDGDLTERLEKARLLLLDAGLIGPRRGEMMPVRPSFDADPIAIIDRSAMRILGLWATKVHVNGLVNTGSDTPPDVWLSLRAAHSTAFPGYFDTLVAGGQPHDLDAATTAVKEAWEEAGIDATLMENARHIGDEPVCYVSRQGFHQELLSVYDLVLPRDWSPTCIDGEVESNTLVSMDELRSGLAGALDIKFGSHLVCQDVVTRHGT
ncbi:thiamine pyrophosphokinase [Agrobacterium albertimagni AOL15]|uniref:Thiamine pyrophosphokinase n=1 Tax=Agrobacterium albertimagni AOL15 TaxID=1156935 RepID=K2Q5A4_9HYPH|nr:NUDIX domain-containing protein [Agrobacterium albertimagni]EKF60320.1 thiamine pyrophosphokinase [Agrobacterium albertimagni AOL15]